VGSLSVYIQAVPSLDLVLGARYHDCSYLWLSLVHAE